MKRVSIVVCVYNRADLIEKCLDSILSQDFDDYDVIVIDDGSTDETGRILSRYGTGGKIKVRRNEKNLGLLRSRNLGAKGSDAEIVAFADSDCVADKKWIRELVVPFGLSSDIVIVGGKVLDGPADNYWGLVCKGIYRVAGQSGYVNRIIGTNMAIKRDFLLKNEFDEKLKYYADEADLCFRAIKKGLRVYFTDKAQVVHFHRNNFRGMVRQRFMMGMDNCYFRLKSGIFPPISVKSIVLLMAILCAAIIPGIMKASLSALLLLLYVAIVFYEDARTGEKNIGELALSLPGRIAMAVCESSGYLYGIIRSIKIRGVQHG